MTGPVRSAWIVALALTAPLVGHAEPSAGVRAEVDFLLGTIAASGCEFSRNGVWYDAARAVAHLRSKYAYMRQRDSISSTEEFITKAASHSALTGRAYWIHCPGAAVVSSDEWLRDQLRAYRGSARSSMAPGP